MLGKFKIIRKKLSYVFGATGTSSSQTYSINGLVKQVHLRVPNFTNAITAGFDVADENGYVIYSTTGRAKNANHNITDMVIPLAGANTVTATLSGNAGGAGGTVVIVITYWGWETGY